MLKKQKNKIQKQTKKSAFSHSTFTVKWCDIFFFSQLLSHKVVREVIHTYTYTQYYRHFK